jgi:hypothetical protein
MALFSISISEGELMVLHILWNSCKSATTLVLVHAAPRGSGTTPEAAK